MEYSTLFPCSIEVCPSSRRSVRARMCVTDGARSRNIPVGSELATKVSMGKGVLRAIHVMDF